MRRSPALLTALVLGLLVVPALALASIKRGVYIDTKTNAYIETNAAVTGLKTLQISCLRSGSQQGANTIKKGVKFNKSTGKFSFSGRSTLRSTENSVISLKVTGKIGTKATGKVTYSGKTKPCDDQTFSAKYYGVHPQG